MRLPTCVGMPAKARVCAYTVLRRVFEDGAYADRALQAEAKELDARDRALAMRLIYGAVQRKGTLDHLIERLAERPSERLDARLLAALRLGLYELLYLGGAPDHAVVADGVELAKGGARGGHGLVNAVLRRGAREGPGLLDGLSDETPQQAAVKHSHPEWIARLWWEQLGASDTRALMAYDNEPGEVALRVNTLLTDAATLAGELPVATHTDPDLPEALVLEGPFDAHDSPAWRAGAFLAQSRAAMQVSRVLDPQPGERVLDLCAAPGGKSTHLAALDAGARARSWRSSATHGGQACSRAPRSVCTQPMSALRSPTPPLARREGAVFDRVLVDPPCSGLGTLQARADLRWRVTPQDVREMTRTQASILAAGAAAAPSGRRAGLLYVHDLPSRERAPDHRFPGCPHRLQPR